MRIAVSGSHATGKSTLLAEISHLLPDAVLEEEAYFALLAEGTVFADPPDASDYEHMIRRACEQLASSVNAPVLFDRTPADYLAYLIALEADIAHTDLVTRTQSAMAGIDLVVFVPIEEPDRIRGSERRVLRSVVDRTLRDLWMDDGWGWGVRALEVFGSSPARARQVLAHLQNT